MIKWWSRRWIAKKTVKRDVSKLESILEDWTDRKINPHQLTRYLNPCARETDLMLHEIFAFMIFAKSFKLRDLAEHIRDKFDEVTPAQSRATAKRIVDTLVLANIVKSEKRGLYCL